MGQTQNAISGYKAVLSLDAKNEDAKSSLADITRTSMSVNDYITYTKQNSKNTEEAADTIYDYAIDLHKKNKLDDAIICYKEVLNLDDTNSDAYVNLAIAYKQKGDLPQAVSILQTAKSKFPANSQVLKILKECSAQGLSDKLVDASKYYNQNDFEKALSVYNSMPPSYDSTVGIAACYAGLKNDDKALEYYKKAFAMRGSSSDVAYYIAALDSEKEKWEEAKYYLAKALSLNPKNSRAIELNKYVKEQSSVKLIK